mmetsp:Transcript_15952/g.48043  ORF Transcript_15952/g.48043 Transcript_15952/m.48043 type:complete len:230 (-) Transcript_15952:620-1309(-)
MSPPVGAQMESKPLAAVFSTWYQENCVCPGGRSLPSGAQMPAKPSGFGAVEAACAPLDGAALAATPRVVEGRRRYDSKCHWSSCVAVVLCSSPKAPSGPAGAAAAAAAAFGSALPPFAFCSFCSLPSALPPLPSFFSFGKGGATYMGMTARARLSSASFPTMALTSPPPATSMAADTAASCGSTQPRTLRAATSLAVASSKGKRTDWPFRSTGFLGGGLLPGRDVSQAM